MHAIETSLYNKHNEKPYTKNQIMFTCLYVYGLVCFLSTGILVETLTTSKTAFPLSPYMPLS